MGGGGLVRKWSSSLPEEATASLVGGEISIESAAQQRADNLNAQCLAERAKPGAPEDGGTALKAICEEANQANVDAYLEKLNAARKAAAEQGDR